MTPATEARLLALATAVGAAVPWITVCPTAGAGSRSWRKGFEATARGAGSAVGATEEDALAALEAKLVSRLRDDITMHRDRAARHKREADRIEAALTAALATPEHATLPAPVCPAPTGAT